MTLSDLIRLLLVYLGYDGAWRLFCSVLSQYSLESKETWYRERGRGSNLLSQGSRKLVVQSTTISEAVLLFNASIIDFPLLVVGIIALCVGLSHWCF